MMVKFAFLNDQRNRPCIVIIFIEIALYVSDLIKQSEAHDHYYNPKSFRDAIKIENTELKEWDAPEDFKKAMPYYFAGYDNRDRPIWLMEFGKYDLKKLFDEGGQDTINVYEKYTDQFFYLSHNSPKLWPKNPGSNVTVNEWVFILDMEGYSLRQLQSSEVVRQSLKLARDLEISGHNLAYVLILNVNYIGRAIVNIIKPALGGVFEKLQAYSPNKNKWIPEILQRVPRESLPQWYGGYANYTPVAVYG